MIPPDEEAFDAEVAGGGDALPRWMVLLFVLLLVWGAWYLVHFWSVANGAAR
jgi:hypothetical protein